MSRCSSRLNSLSCSRFAIPSLMSGTEHPVSSSTVTRCRSWPWCRIIHIIGWVPLVGVSCFRFLFKVLALGIWCFRFQDVLQIIAKACVGGFGGPSKNPTGRCRRPISVGSRTALLPWCRRRRSFVVWAPDFLLALPSTFVSLLPLLLLRLPSKVLLEGGFRAGWYGRSIHRCGVLFDRSACSLSAF